MQWDELLLHRFLIATSEHKEEGYREFQSEGLHDEGVPPREKIGGHLRTG
jgi:hypothetical protein